MTTLILATGNAHKVAEIQVLLGPTFQCVDQRKFSGAPTAVEDAPTFAGNAIKKAAVLAAWLDKNGPQALARFSKPVFVLADDSGLEVDFLGGAPGVHSARFAFVDAPAKVESNAPDAANIAKLLRLLAGVPRAQRTARFRCVLALLELGPENVARKPEVFAGACAGHIDDTPRGQGGFGYDPLFIPEGFQQSFAELGPEVKNRLSHRAQALVQLRAHLTKLPNGKPG